MNQSRSVLCNLLPRPYQLLRRSMRSLRLYDGGKEDRNHPGHRFQDTGQKSSIRANRTQLVSRREINVELGYPSEALHKHAIVSVDAEDAVLAWDALVYGVLIPSAATSFIAIDFVDYLELFRQSSSIAIQVAADDTSGQAGDCENTAHMPAFVTAWIPTSWTESEILGLYGKYACENGAELIALLPHSGHSLVMITGRA